MVDTEPADTCYRCGYALRGVANDRPCPECGLLAERSRRVSDELHNSRPRWLRRISRGVNVLLFALLLIVGWGFALGPVMEWVMDLYQSTGFTSLMYYRLSAIAPLMV